MTDPRHAVPTARPRRRSRRYGRPTAAVATLAGIALAVAAGITWGPVRSALGLEGPDDGRTGAPVTDAASGASSEPSTVPASADAGGPPLEAAPEAVTGEPTGLDDLDNLDPELRRRFEAAQEGAAAAGLVLELTSGWRSVEEQQALVDAALQTYGSAEEAHRWVLPPERSEHVAGRAVDVGPQDAAAWLAENAATYGLCRTYENEWWHFEAMPADGVCPAPLPDSSWGW